MELSDLGSEEVCHSVCHFFDQGAIRVVDLL